MFSTPAWPAEPPAESPVPAHPMQGLCAAAGRDLLGECPLWDDRAQVLWWVDIRAPAVCRLDPARERTDRWRMPELVGSLALTDDGSPSTASQLLVALGRRLALFNPGAAQPHPDLVAGGAGEPTQPAAVAVDAGPRPVVAWAAAGGGEGRLHPVAEVPLDHPDHRFNDGRCDPAGRFWVGTMNNLTRGPEGRMFRFDLAQGLVEFPALAPGLRIPNSLAFSPDGRTMYFADSLDHAVRAWDYDPSSGLPGASRPLSGCTPPAFPDGACVDEEGGLWSARFHGGCIVRHHPSGSVDRVIALPVRRPTSCTFGGPDLRTLYVTTTCQHMSAAERQAEPLAGALLALDVGCRGLPEPRFSLHGLQAPAHMAAPDASGASDATCGYGAREALGPAATLHQP